MKGTRRSEEDELRPEYSRSDFSRLVRGGDVERLQSNSNVVVIDPLTTTEAAVNAALRSLADIARRTARSGVRRSSQASSDR